MSRAPWLLLLPVVVMGILIGTQFRLQQRLAAAAALDRPEVLAARLKSAEAQQERLAQENGQLRQQLAQLPAVPAADPGLAILAGTVAVAGPGLTIRLDESPARDGGRPDMTTQLRDEDVLRVINELLAAGAEAISVNGQRMVAISEIRNVGNKMIINGVMVAPPMEIVAIGDPAVLQSALRMRGGVVDYLQLWSIEVKIQQAERLVVPAYRGTPAFRFATPADS